MKISEIAVTNHSRIPDCRLEVRDNLVFVGPNGSGKSSLLRCLDLLFGKTMQQLYYNINKADFADEEAPLLIEGKLVNLDEDELSFFPDEIDTFDESLTILLEASIDGDDIAINRYCPNGPSKSNLTTTQLKSIGWHFVPSDFSAKVLNEGRKTIVDDFLSGVDTSSSEEELTEAIASLCGAISNSEAFDTALSSLASELNPTLKGGVKSSDLRFIPGAAIDGNLLSDVRLQIKGVSGEMKEATKQSDGTKALIAFAVFGLLNPGDILAIDEPETHLHPTAQRNLMRILQSKGGQLVIATHSGVIAGEFNPDNIVVTKENATPSQPEKDFLQDDLKTLARWWIGSRIELLTASRIIAVEGQSDRMVLEKVAELTGSYLDRDGIEILEAGGCGEMQHVKKIFGAEGFGSSVSILIDQDAEDKMAKALGIPKEKLGSKSVFVSRADLEDEYVSALGAAKLWQAIKTSNIFTANMLRNCPVEDGASAPSDEKLSSFCRNKHYKIASAVVACSLLDSSSSQKVSSIVEALKDVTN